MAEDITEFEGLVVTTSLKFAHMVGLECEDFQQDLRIAVLKAVRAYRPARCRTSRRSWVYSCVANRVKDAKRDYWRRRNGKLEVVHIEDMDESFDLLDSNLLGADQVYGRVEIGAFVMPSTISPVEQEIALLMVIGYALPSEIAPIMGMEYGMVVTHTRALRDKLRDWQPSAAERTSIAA